jgi:hypothetical protein
VNNERPNIEQLSSAARKLGEDVTVWQKGIRLRLYTRTSKARHKAYLELFGRPEKIEGASYELEVSSFEKDPEAALKLLNQKHIGLWYAWLYCRYSKENVPEAYRADYLIASVLMHGGHQ